MNLWRWRYWRSRYDCRSAKRDNLSSAGQDARQYDVNLWSKSRQRQNCCRSRPHKDNLRKARSATALLNDVNLRRELLRND
jgi:hypothetical protein